MTEPSGNDRPGPPAPVGTVQYFDATIGAMVTRYPAGKAALGADDLTNWSKRRARGWSGSDDWRVAKKWRARGR